MSQVLKSWLWRCSSSSQRCEMGFTLHLRVLEREHKPFLALEGRLSALRASLILLGDLGAPSTCFIPLASPSSTRRCFRSFVFPQGSPRGVKTRGLQEIHRVPELLGALSPCQAPQHPAPSSQQADAIARPRGLPARAKRTGLAWPRRRGGPDERPDGLGRQPAGPGGRGPAGEREAAAGEREAAAGAGELRGESRSHPEGEPAAAPVLASRGGMRGPSPAISLGIEQ